MNCEKLAKEINDKVNNDFNISKSDIENIILKYHYPAFLYENGSGYKNCDKGYPLREIGSQHKRGRKLIFSYWRFRRKFYSINQR